MASKIQNLHDQRAKAIEAMKDVMAEAEDGKMSKDQEEKWNKIDAEVVELTAQIEKAEKVKAYDQMIADHNGQALEDGPKEVSYKDAFKNYASGRRLNDGDLSALEKGFNPNAGDNIVNAAQQTSTTTGGGYMIPEDFSNEIYKVMSYFGPFAQMAESNDPALTAGIIRTATGRPLPWPTNDDTGNSGYLLAENGDSTSSATALTFGVKQLDAYNYTSGLIQVPKQLLQDEGVNFPVFLGQQLGERLGRAFNTAVTRGNGSSQPQGFEDAATQGKLSASATAITADELIDLEHSVDRAYRQKPSAAFMLHDSILAAVKKLTVGSSDDRPIWLPSYREGEPDRLLGYRYWVNNDLDSTLAADKRSVFFGDWSAHKVRIVNDIELLRLDERFAEKYQVGWVGFMRFDSELMDASAIKFIRQITT